jgi:molecular chaperone DnaK
LSQEEIAKMKAEAAANADTDKQAKERAEKLNMADGLIFQTEKQMKEIGDKIPADKKAAIESALTELKEAHKLEDLARVDKASEAMNAAWQAASQDI